MKVLYFLPSYHSSFFEAEALTARGHQVDIYVPQGYPEQLLWDESKTFSDPKRLEALEKKLLAIKFPRFLVKVQFLLLYLVTTVFIQFWRIKLWKSYDVVYIFGRTEFLSSPKFLEKYIQSLVVKGKIKFCILPAGCRDEAPQAYWRQFDAGAICSSCFINSSCNDSNNIANIDRINRFKMKVGGNGSHTPPGLDVIHFQSRSVDLDLWKPGIEIPQHLLLPSTNSLRVLHSFASNGRGGSVNIKGSNFIEAAISSLQDKGYEIELVSITNLKSTEMRFIQAQCDVIVDQLIYGWWGSTALEGLASGKPVICYLREEFLGNFVSTFPQYKGSIPVINATISSVESEIEKLLKSPSLLKQKGSESRIFAESFLDPSVNVLQLEQFLASDYSL